LSKNTYKKEELPNNDIINKKANITKFCKIGGDKRAEVEVYQLLHDYLLLIPRGA